MKISLKPLSRFRGPLLCTRSACLRGKPLSTVTLPRLNEELGIAAVPHGFRSSFRDWAAERTNTPREVVEAALAHTVQNPTEAPTRAVISSSVGGGS